ncbi:MAG: gamma-butyrobetaine hydroxylase-like domain-containing protein, partial [Ilumatobacteraceae bacterium]
MSERTIVDAIVTTRTPDFETYPDDPVVEASASQRWVELAWADGTTARFHHVWLRDNCPCASCVHPVTKEQTFELEPTAAPMPDGPPTISKSGALVVVWADAHHRSAYHPGWLRAHRYDGPRESPSPVTTWDGSTPGLPPTYDGPAVLDDDDALHEWLVALRDVGFTRLVDVPLDPEAVGRAAARIGPIRDTNFGVLWDVRSEPAPVTNANTDLSLPPHVDLCTREYQPGLQFLHC